MACLQLALAVLAAVTLAVNSLPHSTGDVEILTTRLHVSEHGAEYNETLTYDPANHLISFHVPKHHELSEHVTIMHVPTKKSLTLLPDHSYCELKDIPDDFDPVNTFQTLATIESLHPVATSEASVLRKLIDVEVGEATSADLAGLPESMRELCQGLPVHRVLQIEAAGSGDPGEVEEEELLQRHLNSQLLNRHRKKRNTGTCDLTYIVTRRDRTQCQTCHYCLWATCPLRNPGPKCRNNQGTFMEHYTSSVGRIRYATVLCCDSGTATDFCQCNEINQYAVRSSTFASKFRECQDKAGMEY